MKLCRYAELMSASFAKTREIRCSSQSGQMIKSKREVGNENVQLSSIQYNADF